MSPEEALKPPDPARQGSHEEPGEPAARAHGEPAARAYGEPAARAYEEFPPTRFWEPWAWSTWRFLVGVEGEPVFHLIPPDGTLSVIVGAPDREAAPVAQVVGPHLDPRDSLLPPGAWWLGLRLWPGAGPGLFSVPISSLRNTVIPLAQLDVTFAAQLEREVDGPSDTALGRLLEVAADRIDPEEVDSLVVSSARSLFGDAGRVAVKEMAERANLSPRQLRRRFKRSAGLSPKELARAFRARAASVGMVETSANLGRISHAVGYSDQAHMVRDFHSVVGTAPREARENLRAIRHGWVRVPPLSEGE